MGVGLFSILAPGAAGISLATLLTGGLGVYGIAQIIAFARLPREQGSGWTLANGVAVLAESCSGHRGLRAVD